MEKSNIGLIGLAVMGENLALNIEGHGYQVSLYNRPHRSGPEMVDVFFGKQRKWKKICCDVYYIRLCRFIRTSP